MDFSTLTTEQLEAIKAVGNGRTTAFYDHEQTVIDETTGEILKTAKQTIRKASGEPDFVKLYYKTMMAFQGVDDIPLKFIISMSSHMSWSNEGQPITFQNTRLVREAICAECEIKDSMCKKYIYRCIDSGILFPKEGYRGAYEVNPWLIAKGRWDNLKELRTNFDFVNGKWSRTVEVKDEVNVDVQA